MNMFTVRRRTEEKQSTAYQKGALETFTNGTLTSLVDKSMQQQQEDMKSTKRKQSANTSYQNRNEQIEQTLQYSLVAHTFVTTARTALLQTEATFSCRTFSRKGTKYNLKDDKNLQRPMIFLCKCPPVLPPPS